MLGRIVWIPVVVAVLPASCLGQVAASGNPTLSGDWSTRYQGPFAERQPSQHLQSYEHPQEYRTGNTPPGPPAGPVAPTAQSNQGVVAGMPVPSGSAALPSSTTGQPEQLPGRTASGTIPLRPPKSASRLASDGRPTANAVPNAVTVASSLAVVLGLFFLVAWFLRRSTPGPLSPLPSEVFEVLGRSTLGGQHQVQLVRCGNRVLLISAGPAGPETLCEITDPDEVTQLLAMCRQGRPDSAAASFRQMVDQFGGSGTPGRAGARS